MKKVEEEKGISLMHMTPDEFETVKDGLKELIVKSEDGQVQQLLDGMESCSKKQINPAQLSLFPY